LLLGNESLVGDERMVDDSLEGLAAESKKLNEALLNLVESATGSRPPLASSGSPL